MISEETITKHLDWLLGQSDPGDALHHLHVVTAPEKSTSPLGVVDDKDLAVAVYALAPDDSVNTEDFIAHALYKAAREAAKSDETIIFAGLSQEVWLVESESREAMEEVRRLSPLGKLHEHPDAVEVTVIYAACRDGRRWRGRRYLTGPKAGQNFSADVLVGPVQRRESQGISVGPLLCMMVGIRS